MHSIGMLRLDSMLQLQWHASICRLTSQHRAQLELVDLPVDGQQPVAMSAAEAEVGELSLPPVTDVDGGVQPALQARVAARRYYYVGFAALPWFWVVNIWLFFPDFWHGRDPVVAKCEKQPSVGCAAPTMVAECSLWHSLMLANSWARRCAGPATAAACLATPPLGQHPATSAPCPSCWLQMRGAPRWGLSCTPASSCPGCCST